VAVAPEAEDLMGGLQQAYLDLGPSSPLEIGFQPSRAALGGLRSGQYDLALVTGEPRAEDMAEFQMALLGRSAVVMVVHPANPITSLSPEEVQRLFSGEVLFWGDLGGESQEIEVLSREEGAELRQAFEEMAMDGRPVTPAARVLPDCGAMVDWVAQHPAAIGYIGLGELSPAVRALAVNDVLPTPEGLAEESYPLTYPLLLVLEKEPSAEAMDFVRFALSLQGQDILGRTYGRAH
jgi:phosphate transport system substrate-binding protein